MNIPNTHSAAWAIPGLIREKVEGTYADRIIDTIARYYNVERTTIISKRRDTFLVRARHLAIYLIRLHCKILNDGKIAQLLHRDTSTICDARKTVKNRLEKEDVYQTDLKAIEELLS